MAGLGWLFGWPKENGIEPPKGENGSVDIQKLLKLYDEWCAKNGGKGYRQNASYESILANSAAWKNDLTPRGHVDITPGITKESYVSRELGVDLQTAERYVKAIDAYADEKYADIRAYQRGEGVIDNQEIANISEDIEEYIKKAPRWNGGETYRGMGLSDKDLSIYTVGSVHDMKGVSSWSSEEEVARQFGDEMNIKKQLEIQLYSIVRHKIKVRR